jgi:hypothetical protein
MTDWSEIGRRSKRRGKTYERRCAQLLSDWTKINFRKTPGSGGFNKQGGVVIREELFCGDLICDKNDFKFCVEAKNRESFSFIALLKNPNTADFSEWWWQCLDDAKRVSLYPILFFKPNNQDDFIALTEEGLTITGYKGNSFKLNVYTEPVTLKIKDAKDKKKVVVITTALPTPYIINWKDFTAEVKPNIMFEGGL